jgi:hypothetical protein
MCSTDFRYNWCNKVTVTGQQKARAWKSGLCWQIKLSSNYADHASATRSLTLVPQLPVVSDFSPKEKEHSPSSSRQEASSGSDNQYERS